MIIAKISGDNGHSCLVPLVILNSEEKVPEVKTLADGWVPIRLTWLDLRIQIYTGQLLGTSSVHDQMLSQHLMKSKGVLCSSAYFNFSLWHLELDVIWWILPGLDELMWVKYSVVWGPMFLRIFLCPNCVIKWVYNLLGREISLSGLGIVGITACGISLGKWPLVIAKFYILTRWGASVSIHFW